MSIWMQIGLSTRLVKGASHFAGNTGLLPKFKPVTCGQLQVCSEGAAPSRSAEEEAEIQSKCEQLKSEANALYLEGELLSAREVYTRALEMQPRDPKLLSVLHANRAACSLKEGKVRAASYFVLAASDT